MKTGRYEHETETEAWMEQWAHGEDKPEYFAEFMSCLQGVEYTTRKQYLEHVWRYLRWLQDRSIDISDPKNLEPKAVIYINQYLSYLKSGVPGKTKEITGSYRAVAWTALNRFYGFLIDCYDFAKNPMVNVARPNSTKDKVDKDVLTEAEMQQIIHNILNTNLPDATRKNYHRQMKNRDMFMFLLLIDTGARIAGLLELNLEDIDFEQQMITVTSKGHVTRDYYLTEDTMDWCHKWLEDRHAFVTDPENRAVFLDHHGKRWNYRSVAHMLDLYSYNVDEHVTPHTTRRSIATLLYEQTSDIELVKDKLGHASVATTSRYIKKGNEHIRKANAIGAGVISRALK